MWHIEFQWIRKTSRKKRQSLTDNCSSFSSMHSKLPAPPNLVEGTMRLEWTILQVVCWTLLNLHVWTFHCRRSFILLLPDAYFGWLNYCCSWSLLSLQAWIRSGWRSKGSNLGDWGQIPNHVRVETLWPGEWKGGWGVPGVGAPGSWLELVAWCLVMHVQPQQKTQGASWKG